MKKFIAVLISASLFVAPFAFAEDAAPADVSATQQMTTDQAAPAANESAAPVAKPAKKAGCKHNCNCANKGKKRAKKSNSHSAKKAAPAAAE